MAFAYTLPLRIVQAVFAIIVLGLMAYAADDWSYWWSPDSVNFLVFAAASIAGDVFAAFLWLLFLATTIMAALHVSRSSKNNSHHDPAMEVAV
ncbi:54f7129a-efa7-43ac-b8d1-5305d889ddf7 [Sclerotinia trifoliorum]|uniref:54f7129a-efa7-43ac-b8d1-5305d889ddf7 n=1 Tax=Sclerotinia trifoliorum TaxID=28548 RepID=A0A8H2W2I5_9HELO|nr:54f7129a-efa7-43ac-b8d1-5305d889ddf7 [Sclerotinia trifoliorum]